MRIPTRLVLSFLLLTALTDASVGKDIRDSVVKIHSTQRMPNFIRPWEKMSAREISGSGAIIEGNRILTNAHVVEYASRILVQPHQSADRIAARVVAFAPGIDLALLELIDDSVLEGLDPLPVAEEMPRLRDTLNAYGYPIGGEQLSVTEGIVSRIEYAGYSHGTSGLRIQVDAAINSGNSGGPAIADDQIVGLVFSRIGGADNIGYVIPAEEIRLFLEDSADGTYDGKPRLNDQFQTVENSALRTKLGLGRDSGGLMVTKPVDDDESYPLRPWDVITRIGNQPLDKQGSVRIQDDLRLSFQYLIPRMSQDDEIELTVLRDGIESTVEVPVQRRSNLVVPFLSGDYPRHFIFGPVLFTVATQELVSALRGPGQSILSAQRSPLIARRFDKPRFPHEELVVLGPRFPHPIVEGYDDQVLAVVSQINDVKIRNLAHLVETIRDARDEFLTIRFSGAYETMVFRLDDLRDSTEQILEDEGIRYQFSSDLRAIWDAR